MAPLCRTGSGTLQSTMRPISIISGATQRSTQSGALPAYPAGSAQEEADDYTLDIPVVEAPPAPATVDLPAAQQANGQSGDAPAPLRPFGDLPEESVHFADHIESNERPAATAHYHHHRQDRLKPQLPPSRHRKWSWVWAASCETVIS